MTDAISEAMKPYQIQTPHLKHVVLIANLFAWLGWLALLLAILFAAFLLWASTGFGFTTIVAVAPLILHGAGFLFASAILAFLAARDAQSST